jgi:hypothetical protein
MSVTARREFGRGSESVSLKLPRDKIPEARKVAIDRVYISEMIESE